MRGMNTLDLAHGNVGSVVEEMQEEVNKVRSMKSELENLKKEFFKLSRSQTGPSALDIYQNKIFQNLESQVESLKEELQAEADLRARVENELVTVLEDLEFYKNASSSDVIERRIREIHQYYEPLVSQNKFKATSTEPNSEFGQIPGNEKAKRCIMEDTGFDEEATNFKRPDNKSLEEVQRDYMDAIGLIKHLEQKLADLQEKYDASCQMAKESFQKVSESIELAKTAADERDAATLAETNAQHELSRLQQVIDKLVDEAGQRTAEEVEKVRAQANSNISKLLEELHTVEQDRTKLEHEIERLKSSKTATNLSEAIPMGDLDPRLESTMQRAHFAEQQRNELKLRLETAETSYERNLTAKQTEIQRLQDEIKSLKERLEYAESQRIAMEERFKRQLEALSSAENQALEAKRQANAAQRSALQQVLLANQTVELHDAESKRRMEAMEKANQSSVQRWQEILTKQHTLAAQWRSEAENLADQMEQQGLALRDELQNERARANKLAKKIVLLEQKRNAEVSYPDESPTLLANQVFGNAQLKKVVQNYF